MEGNIDAEWICLAVGPVIAILVSLFKRVGIVGNHPKIVAALLSAVFAVISGLTYGGMDWERIATCIIIPFSAAVASFEVAKESKR